MEATIGNKSGALSGKVALITGGGSGIGRATAILFAQEGAALGILGIDPAGEAVAQSIVANGGRAFFEQADVTRAEDCRSAIERVQSTFGALHIIVNSAGVIQRASVVDLSEADWDRIMAVNVKSIFLLAKLGIPVMVASGGGSIINIASTWGLLAGPKSAAYCASKGAVVLLTKAMAIDHGAQKIRVNCICPGDTDTPMLRSEAQQLGRPVDEFLSQCAQRPLGRLGTPEEIAETALFLASDKSSFVTGAAFVVDGGGSAGTLS